MLRDWQRDWWWPPGARVEPADRLHLTLHFIGQVPVARVDDLAAALRVPLVPFQIEFGHAEIWPRGLAVLNPLAVAQELVDLHRGLRGALQRLALPVEERAFRPHLTLARKAAGAVAPAQPLRLRWQVRDYTLVSSARGYRVLARYA